MLIHYVSVTEFYIFLVDLKPIIYGFTWSWIWLLITIIIIIHKWYVIEHRSDRIFCHAMWFFPLIMMIILFLIFSLCESLLQRKKIFFFVSFPNTFLPKAVMMMMMMFLSWRHHHQHHNCSYNCCSIFLARETQRTSFNSITSKHQCSKMFFVFRM